VNAGEVRWSRSHFRLLALNGIWGLPGTGIVFQKVSQFELALVEVMPWSKEMGQGYLRGMDVPATAQELLRAQRRMFEMVAKNFGAAGVDVTDPRDLLKD
jgi:hypothetical protein